MAALRLGLKAKCEAQSTKPMAWLVLCGGLEASTIPFLFLVLVEEEKVIWKCYSGRRLHREPPLVTQGGSTKAHLRLASENHCWVFGLRDCCLPEPDPKVSAEAWKKKKTRTGLICPGAGGLLGQGQHEWPCEPRLGSRRAG